jgi:tetratricopeptide (TPR) repeat protein
VGAGRTLRRIDRHHEAALIYEELVKLRDEDYQYFFELGLTYAALDRHQEARETYLKVIELLARQDPEAQKFGRLQAEVYTHLGMSSIALKRYNESIEQFDKALRSDGSYVRALYGKGIAYRDLGQLDSAEDHFKRSAEADPDNPEYVLNLGVLHHKFRKDTRQALDYYQKYYQAGGTDPQVAQWIRECGGQPPSE